VIVKRRVRKDKPHQRISRGYTLDKARSVPTLQEHDRGFRSFQQGQLVGVDLSERLRSMPVEDHHGEGLAVPVLPLAELRNRRFASRIAREVEATDSSNRDHGASP
jgi:hypothetical protein